MASIYSESADTFRNLVSFCFCNHECYLLMSLINISISLSLLSLSFIYVSSPSPLTYNAPLRRRRIMAPFPLIRHLGSLIYRNRRQVKYLTIAGVSLYTAYQLYKFYKEFKETKQKIQMFMYDKYDEGKLYDHLRKARQECFPALANFLKALQKRVLDSVDVVTAVKKLKTGKAEKNISKEEQKYLWNEVKNNVFVRFLLSYYTFNLLNVVLRVQVHILGYYAYEASKKRDRERWDLRGGRHRNSLEVSGSEGQGGQGRGRAGGEKEEEEVDTFTSEDRAKVLTMIYQYFLNDGLMKLKEDLERVVLHDLQEWHVHENTYSYIDLYDKLLEIRRKIEGPRGGDSSSPLLKYCINMNSPEYLETSTSFSNIQEKKMKMITSSSLNLSNVNSTDLFSTSTSISTSTTTTTNLKDNQEKGIEKEKEKINLNPHLVSMINETWDALESPIFKFALEDCLDVTFRTFCNQMYTQCFTPAPVSEPVPSSDASPSLSDIKVKEKDKNQPVNTINKKSKSNNNNNKDNNREPQQEGMKPKQEGEEENGNSENYEPNTPSFFMLGSGNVENKEIENKNENGKKKENKNMNNNNNISGNRSTCLHHELATTLNKEIEERKSTQENDEQLEEQQQEQQQQQQQEQQQLQQELQQQQQQQQAMQSQVVQKPLAKLIPFFKSKATEILSQDQDSPYLNSITQINSVDSLCNSFFQQESTSM